jgi:hypothetical protein
MGFTRDSGLHVHECSLKKISLEDSFFKIIKGDGSPGVINTAHERLEESPQNPAS